MKQLYSFCHIPKTGGTSVEHLIKKIHGKRYYRFSEYKYPFGNFYQKYGKSSGDLVAIGGHYNWDFPEQCGIFEDKEIHHFVFLREPVERALSFLYFSNEQFHKDPIKYFTDRTNGDWKYRSNTMVKFLAGIDREPNKVDLALAKVRLQKSNVGFTECFNESLLHFQNKYPGLFHTVEYEYKNKTKVDWHEINHSQEVIDCVRGVNMYDLELYEWAKNCLLWDKFLGVVK